MVAGVVEQRQCLTHAAHRRVRRNRHRVLPYRRWRGLRRDFGDGTAEHPACPSDSEAALDRLAPHLPSAARQRVGWTRQAPLPGGDFAVDGLGALAAALASEYPFLAPAHADRLAAAYGTRAKAILGGSRAPANLGISFGATLTQAELCYLMTQEWAQTAEDVLWRRTKLGLAVMADETAAVARFMVDAVA
jgi:glycerol-3-phosphate dehydrogenase